MEYIVLQKKEEYDKIYIPAIVETEGSTNWTFGRTKDQCGSIGIKGAGYKADIVVHLKTGATILGITLDFVDDGHLINQIERMGTIGFLNCNEFYPGHSIHHIKIKNQYK